MPDFVLPDEETRHERLRIARDLHDTVAQRLAALGFALDAVIADEAIPVRQKRTLREMRLEVTSIVEELRDEILALRADSASTIESWLRERLTIEIIWHRINDAQPPNGHYNDVKYLLLELIRNAIVYRGLAKSAITENASNVDVAFLELSNLTLKPLSQSPEKKFTLGRVGIHERIHNLGIYLDEREEGFALRW